jgi:hypothetical protein
MVQRTTLQNAWYASNDEENPEALFGMESAMTIEGISDPYYRACIVEYIHFMRLTHPGHVMPKFYVYK